MEQAPIGQMDNFDRLYVMAVFRRAVDRLAPNATGGMVAAILHGKPSPSRAQNWYAGRRAAPGWALAILEAALAKRAQEDAAIAGELAKMKTRPRYHPGPRNLAKWKAENPR
jgi:hypothetical protein